MYDVTTPSDWGGVGRRQRDDWCFVLVNAYSDWVTASRNGGGNGHMKWGKLSVCSNSPQWREIRVVRYKWRVVCRPTKPGWVTVQNRLIYLSHINSASIFFFFPYGPRCCHPILRPKAACDIGHILTSSCIDHQSWISLANNNLNYCNKFTFISVLRRSESVLWFTSRESTVSK